MTTFLLKSFARIAAPTRQDSTHPLERHTDTESNPYSPALCIALLLIVGLFVKLGPAVHAHLAQN
jgi:hypothetical protein